MTRACYSIPALLLISMCLNPGAALGATETETEQFEFGPHPRLKYAMPDELLSDSPSEEYVKKLTARADRILDAHTEIPTGPGQWIFYYACPEHNCSLTPRDGKHVCPQCGKEYSDKRTLEAYVTRRYNTMDRNMITLGQAWQATGDGKYAREVVRALDHYARRYGSLTRHDRWGRKGILAIIGGRRFCQSLSEAVGAIRLAKAYDMVYDWPGLTPGQKKTIEKDFFEPTIESIYRFYPLYDSINNHMTWYNAAAATVGAALGNREMLDRAVNGPAGLLYQFDASVTPSGLWYEGAMAYHFYALQAVLETVLPARACGVDLSGKPVFQRMFSGPLQMAYPNGQTPAINDSDRGNIFGYQRLYRTAEPLLTDETARSFAQSKKLPDLGKTAYRGAGLAYLRRARDTSPLTLILDFGNHGGGHGHPDKLNILLYALGREIFLDPGRLTYRCPEHKSWTRQTVAHNTVIINQHSQAPVAGELLSLCSTSHYDIAVGRASRVYPGVTLTRALALSDSVLVDLFHVQAQKESTIDWALHCNAPLATSLEMTGAPDAFEKKNGYQHLENIARADAAAPFHADWRLSNDKTVRTHLLGDFPLTVFTCEGIGYNLGDRVPALILRTTGKETIFAAIHDLGGSCSAVTEPAYTVKGGDAVLSFMSGYGKTTVRWNPSEKPAGPRVLVEETGHGETPPQ